MFKKDSENTDHNEWKIDKNRTCFFKKLYKIYDFTIYPDFQIYDLIWFSHQLYEEGR